MEEGEGVGVMLKKKFFFFKQAHVYHKIFMYTNTFRELKNRHHTRKKIIAYAHEHPKNILTSA